MFEIAYSIAPTISSVQPLLSINNISNPFCPHPFLSQLFPCYPLDIIIIPKNPLNFPINKLQIITSTTYSPSEITLLTSDNMHHSSYEPIGTIKYQQVASQKELLKTWRSKEGKCGVKEFLKIRVKGSLESEGNITKQVAIVGVKLYYERFEGTKYLYNIGVGRKYPKEIREILESLEYRLKHKMREKMYEECQNLEFLIEKTLEEYEGEKKQEEEKKKQKGAKKIKNYVESNVVLQQINKQYLIRNLAEQFPQDIPPKKQPPHLPSSSSSPVNPFHNTLPQITSIFSPYIQRITPYLIDLLSSPSPAHNQKAILDLWNSIKHQYEMPLIDQQLTMDLILFFSSSPNTDTLNVLLQIFHAFLSSNYTKTLPQHLLTQSLLLFCEMYQSKKGTIGLSINWETIILELFPLIKDGEYFDIVLNSKYITDVKKVEIVLGLMRSEEVKDYHGMLEWLKVLVSKQGEGSSKEMYEMQRQLNSLMDLLQQKLPTNIIMPIRKQMNKVLENGVRRNSIPLPNTSKLATCQYCLLENKEFKNSDALNMHYFKDCVYLMKCKECEQMVEIPKIREHCLGECESRAWRRCGECGVAVRKKDEGVHRNSCRGKEGVFCGLCYEEMEGEEGLKKHVRARKCIRNPRS